MSRPTPSGSAERDGQARQGCRGVIGAVPSGCGKSGRRALGAAGLKRAAPSLCRPRACGEWASGPVGSPAGRAGAGREGTDGGFSPAAECPGRTRRAKSRLWKLTLAGGGGVAKPGGGVLDVLAAAASLRA